MTEQHSGRPRGRGVLSLLTGAAALAAARPVEKINPEALRNPRPKKYVHPGKTPLGAQNFARPTPAYKKKVPATAADRAAIAKAEAKQERKRQRDLRARGILTTPPHGDSGA